MDAIGNALGNTGNKLLGNIVKARLSFYDMVQTVQVTEADGSKSRFSAKVANNADMSALKAKATAAGGTITGSSLDAVKQKFANGKESLDSAGVRSFEVQFNPTTLTLSARGGGRDLIANVTNDVTEKTEGSKKQPPARSGFKYGPLPCFVEIGFKLIFDYELNADAFMRDKFTLNATNAVKDIANLANGKKDFTVLPIVEGFLGAVRSEYHRMMGISWGENISYRGMLNSVSARYTMFSITGQPIRAEVDFHLLGSKMDVDNDWESKYKNALSGKSVGDLNTAFYSSDGGMDSMDNNMFSSVMPNILGL